MEDIKEKLNQVLLKTHWHENKHKILESKSGYNFACPMCGDSDKDTTKKRAWILTDKAEPYFFCHHECGGWSTEKFFKHFGIKYEQPEGNDFFTGPVKVKPHYRYDARHMAMSEVSNLAVSIDTILETFKCQRIDENHPQWSYLVSRNLQEHKHYFLYWPEKHRLIILNTLNEPSLENQWDEFGIKQVSNPKVIGFQARGLGNHKVRYITYTLEKIRGEAGLSYRPKPGTEDYVKVMSQVFFSTHVQWDDLVLITEGPIDALFLPNSISISGASKRYDKMDANYHCQYIFDNDSTGIQKQKEKCVKWPNKQMYNWKRLLNSIGTTGLKDINDVVNYCQENGIDKPEFKDYLI